ncbi:hypothetical protein PR048_014186 [Dryococelus australis]|uniref:Uncharacterized protein n=1 Tax=Dryococelus australis TaxID=614101 RepID=A0ABQ9HDP9_9NEOP|nr:hypothetical protein PR048_014186 [Dryococelus australis]
MERRWNAGEGEREYPEKTRWQVASSSTIATLEGPEVNPPGIEPGSPWWEASDRAFLVLCLIGYRMRRLVPYWLSCYRLASRLQGDDWRTAFYHSASQRRHFASFPPSCPGVAIKWQIVDKIAVTTAVYTNHVTGLRSETAVSDRYAIALQLQLSYVTTRRQLRGVNITHRVRTRDEIIGRSSICSPGCLRSSFSSVAHWDEIYGEADDTSIIIVSGEMECELHQLATENVASQAHNPFQEPPAANQRIGSLTSKEPLRHTEFTQAPPVNMFPFFLAVQGLGRRTREGWPSGELVKDGPPRGESVHSELAELRSRKVTLCSEYFQIPPMASTQLALLYLPHTPPPAAWPHTRHLRSLHPVAGSTKAILFTNSLSPAAVSRTHKGSSAISHAETGEGEVPAVTCPVEPAFPATKLIKNLQDLPATTILQTFYTHILLDLSAPHEQTQKMSCSEFPRQRAQEAHTLLPAALPARLSPSSPRREEKEVGLYIQAPEWRPSVFIQPPRATDSSCSSAHRWTDRRQLPPCGEGASHLDQHPTSPSSPELYNTLATSPLTPPPPHASKARCAASSSLIGIAIVFGHTLQGLHKASPADSSVVRSMVDKASPFISCDSAYPISSINSLSPECNTCLAQILTTLQSQEHTFCRTTQPPAKHCRQDPQSRRSVPLFTAHKFAAALSQIAAVVPRRSGFSQLSLKVARDAKLSALSHSLLRGPHVQSPSRTGFNSRRECSRIFARENRAGRCRWSTMPLVGGFPRGSPVSHAPSFQRCSIHRFTLIGSQDLDVKSVLNVFTHLRIECTKHSFTLG